MSTVEINTRTGLVSSPSVSEPVPLSSKNFRLPEASLVLPPYCRAVYSYPLPNPDTGKLWAVFELPPEIRNITYVELWGKGNPKSFQRTYNRYVRHYRIATPYTVFVLAAQFGLTRAADSAGVISLHPYSCMMHPSVFFRQKPLQTMNDSLFMSLLPNMVSFFRIVYNSQSPNIKNRTVVHHFDYCFSNYESVTMNIYEDVLQAALRNMAHIVKAFYSSEFNNDTHNGLAHAICAFPDFPIRSYAEWEAKTHENPEFIMNIELPEYCRTPAGMIASRYISSGDSSTSDYSIYDTDLSRMQALIRGRVANGTPLSIP